MGWQLAERPKTVKVTRAFANQFANMDPAPHDRPLSERRLQVYRKLFAEGSFRPCTWATAFCKETGGTLRVNGKHTSTLFSSMAETLPEYYVTVEHYECDTLNDVARLYATFDSRMMSRTSRDINMSFAGTVPELANVSARVINVAVPGMSYHLQGHDQSGRVQAAEKAELLLEHVEFVVWLQSICGSDIKRGRTKKNADPEMVDGQEVRKSAEHLRRAAVVGAMMATWFKSKDNATKFWEAVRDETGEKNSLPDRKLAAWLLKTGTANQGVTKEKLATPKEFYSRALHAWNAWRKGQTTNLNYFSDKPVPTAV